MHGETDMRHLRTSSQLICLMIAAASAATAVPSCTGAFASRSRPSSSTIVAVITFARCCSAAAAKKASLTC